MVPLDEADGDALRDADEDDGIGDVERETVGFTGGLATLATSVGFTNADDAMQTTPITIITNPNGPATLTPPSAWNTGKLSELVG